MSIKAHELPDLIAAAVRKAVADKQITDASLASILHFPITLGIITQPRRNPAGTAIPEVAAGERVPFPISTLGYQLKDLESLRNPQSLKVEEHS